MKNPNIYVDYSDAQLSDIYVAGGCFWGVDAYLACIYGVADTTVGYANGHTLNPTYKEVVNNNTGHAETVKIQYDPQRLSLETLLNKFFEIIDPTTLNKQGNDKGTQYRSGIYYVNDSDVQHIEKVINQVKNNSSKPVVTEVKRLEHFYLAEEYHQKYLDKNPNGYCHINLFSINNKEDIISENYLKLDDEQLKKTLNDVSFDVTRKNATETPYSSPEYMNYRTGLYVDITTGEPLFSSQDKYDAGCGWPSFTKPIEPKVVGYLDDLSVGRKRTEIRSRVGDSHLGHVFNDGPKEEGGLRFCINGAALRFIPVEEMDKQGYGKYISSVI